MYRPNDHFLLQDKTSSTQYAFFREKGMIGGAQMELIIDSVCAPPAAFTSCCKSDLYGNSFDALL